jgi:Putative metallopeptidase
VPIRRLAFPLALIVFTATAAAGQQPPVPPPAPEAPGVAAPPALTPPPPAPDRGDFKVVYEKAKNPDYRGLQEVFRGTQLLEETAKALNEKLALPADVTVALRECGAADASYEADRHRISICYELVDAFAGLFLANSGKAPDAHQAGAAVAGATLFALFHETGHALLDLYHLEGHLESGGKEKEEEAADQLATLVLTGSGRQGAATAIDSASTLLVLARDPAARGALAKVPFWSGHGFDERRLANLICWAYGKNPQGLQEQLADGTLLAGRAEGCAGEYEKIAASWAEPLAPYLKGWTLIAAPAPATPPAPSAAPPLPTGTPSPSSQPSPPSPPPPTP